MVPSRFFGSINVPGSLGVGISAFPTIHHCLGMLPLRKLIIASEEGALVVASAGGTKQEIWGKCEVGSVPQPVNSGHLWN